MNLEQVAHFVSHPHELTLQDAEALRSLTAKYPFSSVYPLLYLTALSNGKSPDLDLALKQHAFKLSDRTKLYYLLTSADQSPVIQSPAEKSEAPAATEPQEPAAIEPPEVQTAIIPEEQETEAETSGETETDSESLGFDQLTSAFTLEQHFEVGDASVFESSADEPESPEPESPVEESAEEPAVEEPVEKSEVESSNVAETNLVAEERKSFTSWLKSGQHHHVGPVSPVEEPKKMQASDLIDKFIEEEPSITRSKTDFYSPSKKAKESLDEDAVPVSETLAKIYAAQGNYPKAIHVYHQLMLSVPEKKALFALQIDELKKKITP